jgi:hypothetical protein
MDTFEQYVTLETAISLKEAGFNWHVKSCWDLSVEGDKFLNYDAIYPVDFRNDADDIFYAPTLAVAQKWLREVKLMDAYVTPANGLYFFTIRKYYDATLYHFTELSEYEPYRTYEDALDAAINKGLKLLSEGKRKEAELIDNISKRVQQHFDIITRKMKFSNSFDIDQSQNGVVVLYGFDQLQRQPKAQTVYEYIRKVASELANGLGLDSGVRFKTLKMNESTKEIVSDYSEILFYSKNRDEVVYRIQIRLVAQYGKFVELNLYY